MSRQSVAQPRLTMPSALQECGRARFRRSQSMFHRLSAPSFSRACIRITKLGRRLRDALIPADWFGGAAAVSTSHFPALPVTQRCTVLSTHMHITKVAHPLTLCSRRLLLSCSDGRSCVALSGPASPGRNAVAASARYRAHYRAPVDSSPHFSHAARIYSRAYIRALGVDEFLIRSICCSLVGRKQVVYLRNSETNLVPTNPKHFLITKEARCTTPHQCIQRHATRAKHDSCAHVIR